MKGIDYVIKKAIELGRPVAINISFGNTYGPHDGSGLLERYIESISNNWKCVICIGTGNEGSSAGHVSGLLQESEETVIELAVQSNSASLNVQIWKGYFDEVDISLISPSGVRVGPVQEILGSQRYTVGNTQILLYYGEPSPFSIDQEIYLDFLPKDNYIDSGIWKIVLTPRRIVNGAYALWLPSQSILNEGTGFLFPSSEQTLTVPSTSYGTIAVGAYDDRTMTYADFSGRGPAGPGRRAKPDIVAPGVDIRVLVPGGIFAELSGTSFATPFATGGAALLMEWGVVQGNVPTMDSVTIQRFLIRGADRPIAFSYPNRSWGYGLLDLYGAFQTIRGTLSAES
jgi:subtilisin family serine protease